MKKIHQLNGQSLIDIAIQEYGTIEGLELILLNNPHVNLHSQQMELEIQPKIINAKAGEILKLFKSIDMEIMGREVGSIATSLNQFSDQFSDQFY